MKHQSLERRKRSPGSRIGAIPFELTHSEALCIQNSPDIKEMTSGTSAGMNAADIPVQLDQRPSIMPIGP